MFNYVVDDEIALRILEPRHATELFLLTRESREHLREFLTWADGMDSITDTREFIDSGLRQYARNDGFQAGIWYMSKLAGCIGLHGVNWHDRNAEIGYWLGQTYTGKGIMTRACRAVVDLLFVEYKMHRVEIRCVTENIKSRAIAERLGFRQDGILRDEMWLHTRFVDHVVYSLLENEWREQRK